ncbi:hypothetical protein MHTCC0001_20450 [Flavobacteriaceae bacterium MHTCC 0001]
MECGAPFNGLIETDQHCEEEVLITSLPEDIHGTIVKANITSSERLRITPGTHFVKMVPKLQYVNGFLKKRRNKLEVSGASGGDTLKTFTPKEDPQTINYANDYVYIENISAPIVYYGIYDLYGIAVEEVYQVQPIDYQISLSHLPNDIYRVFVQLQNGDILDISIYKL